MSDDGRELGELGIPHLLIPLAMMKLATEVMGFGSLQVFDRGPGFQLLMPVLREGGPHIGSVQIAGQIQPLVASLGRGIISEGLQEIHASVFQV
jgi:hypothetical protein